MRSILFILLIATTISGCSNIPFSRGIPRSDGVTVKDTQSAIIMGQVSEGFLTQPHGLLINITSLNSQKKIILSTKGNEDDIESRNILGHKFIYEVPPGEYSIDSWSYYHYRGKSKPLNEPILFTVESGKAYYIGSFHATALRFCLSNGKGADSKIDEVKGKYPALSNLKVIDITNSTWFSSWGHTKSEPFAGMAACNQPSREHKVK